MKIIEAINAIDALKVNSFSEVEKIRWLSTLDGIIKEEIIDTHEGGESVTFNGYDESTPTTQELLIGQPYDNIYIQWLEAQIDYANGEYNKYNNSITAYNNTYAALEKWYTRNHMPKRVKIKYF